MAGKGNPKTGGRKKGVQNKVTRAHKQMLKQLKIDGRDPMTFFGTIMRNDSVPYDERKFAAAQLLPYYHPKLASIEARTGGTSHEDRLAALKKMADDET